VTASFEALQPFLIYESTALGDIHLSRYGHSRYSDTARLFVASSWFQNFAAFGIEETWGVNA
jgi:hypothetical protein